MDAWDWYLLAADVRVEWGRQSDTSNAQRTTLAASLQSRCRKPNTIPVQMYACMLKLNRLTELELIAPEPVQVPLQYSNVALIDPVTSAPVRSTWRYLSDGTKVRTVALVLTTRRCRNWVPRPHMSFHLQVRVSRGKQASGSVIPRPEVLLQRRKPRPLPGADGLSVPQCCLTCFLR